MIILNNTYYKETYIQGMHFLYDNNNTLLAMVTRSLDFGLYVTGKIEDIKLWFDSLGINKIKF